jgi:hypothetical protein
MAGTVKRDNIPYDFYSLEISLSSGGEPIAFVSIEEIEYTITINREKMYGSSRLPVARTDGEVEFEGSMTVNRGQYHTIVAQAREVGVPLANLEFNLTIVYGKRSRARDVPGVQQLSLEGPRSTPGHAGLGHHEHLHRRRGRPR